MKRKIFIGFLSMWPTFNRHDNVFINYLNNYYDVEVILDADVINCQKLDLLIYSCFYKSDAEFKFIQKTNFKKLYYSLENDFPDMNIADYAMTQNRFKLENRHMYCPYWFFYSLNYENGKFNNKILSDGINDKTLLNRDFCSFVVSNNKSAIPERTEVYEKISKYKRIVSGGRYLNNTILLVSNKIEFLSKYKFNIAIENSIVNGYITEKIIDAFNAKTIPIYLGAPDLVNEFNSNAFININNFSSYDELLNRIKEIDNNNKLYMKMLSEQKIKHGVIENMQKEFGNFLINVIEGQTFNHNYGRIGKIKNGIK